MTCLPLAEDIKCIVSDVDGTLLDSQHQLHPRTTSAVAALRIKHPDLPFVICSGKAYESCEWIRKALQLPLSFPAIHLGGAKIHIDGSVAQQMTLEPKTALAVIEQCMGYATFLFTANGPVYINEPTEGSRQAQRDWLEVCRKYDLGVENMAKDPTRSMILQDITAGRQVCYKITVCDDAAAASEHVERVKAQCSALDLEITCTRAIPEIPEFMPPNVNKGRALQQLCSIMGIHPTQVLAFGDGDNDIPLLATADYSVAMANAMREPAEIAKYRTLSNDQGGVGAFLERVFGLEGSGISK